jgi:hypothetical protein
MAHAQKPDFAFRRNGRVHLNRRGRQFIRQLAAEVCASVVVMLDTTRSEVVRRVLATHYIRQFPLHFRSRASQCSITFQLESTIKEWLVSSPGRFISVKRTAGTHRIGGWLVWGVGLDVWKKRTINCTCRESNPDCAACCLATAPALTALMLLPLLQ